MWDKWARVLGCTADTVRRMFDQRLVWQQKVELAGRVQKGTNTGQPVGRPSKNLDKQAATGKRTPGERGYLGPTDFLRAERLAVGEWARLEEQNGHGLSRWDLFRQLKFLTAHKVEVLQKAVTELAAQGETLPDFEQKALAHCLDRLQAWQKTKAREKAALKLLQQTGFKERATNRRTSLTKEQETVLLHKSWRFFDYLSWLVANGTSAELSQFFAKPEQFRLHAQETVLLFTDQIPVWLRVEAGSLVVSEAKLTAQRAGQKQRRARRLAAAKKHSARVAGHTVPEEPLPEEASGEQADSYLSRGPGDTNADRWRVTYMARQAVRHFWQPGVVPKGIQGKQRRGKVVSSKCPISSTQPNFLVLLCIFYHISLS